MRSKKGRISAVFLALVLLFSFTLVMFAGCGDEGDGDSNTAKLVTDDSLSDKLLAMYTFEESNPSAGDALNAYDPFTGTAIASANGQYEVNEYVPSITTVAVNSLTQDDYTLTTDSTRAFDVRTPLYLSGTMNELYERTTDSDGNSLPNFEKGVSASFWVYNWDQDKTVSSETEGTLAIDYANIVTNGRLTVTWGNLNDNGTVKYPDQDTTVGRAAYTDKYITGQDGVGSYYDAQAEFTSEQLSKFDTGWARSGGYDTYDFTGWNVISGNVQDADEDSTVDQISDYCYQTWRYVTVSMDEDGISFYMNGRLAYYYPAATYLASAPGWTGEQTLSSTSTSYYYRFIYALVGGQVWDPVWEENTDVSTFGFVFNMFGADAKAYVDDLIIGYALEDSEVQALYQNLSGVTYAAADLTIGTSMSEEEVARENAISEALNDRLAEYQKNIGDNNGAGTYTTSQRDAFIAADGETTIKNEQGYYEELGTTTLVSDTAAGTGVYKPTLDEDGYFEMKITALQLSIGKDDWQGIYTMLGQNVSTKPQSVASIQGSAGMEFFLLESTWGANGDPTSTGDTPAANVLRVWKQGLNTTTGTGHSLTFTSDDPSDVLFEDVQRYSWIVITLRWNGSSLRLTLDYYYYYVGETIEDITPTVGDPFDYTIGFRSEAWYGSVTLNVQPAEGETRSIDEIVDMSDLGLRFGTEDSYLLITDVEGGSSTVSFHEPTASANSVS